MGLLVEDLLLLARLDQQRPLELAPVDLSADRRRRRSTTPTRSRPTATIELSTLASATDRRSSLGDEARLRQVVGNLVTNALTHTPAGTPVDVSVGTARRRRPGALIEVADHGPGHVAEQTPSGCSSASTGPTRRGPRPPAAPGSGCRSWPRSWPPTAGRSRSTASPAGGRASGWSCRWPPTPPPELLSNLPGTSQVAPRGEADHRGHAIGTREAPAAMPAVALAGPVVEVVVPVYNEERALRASIRRLHAYLAGAPSRSPGGSRSPTTPAPTPPGRSATRWPPSCPDVRAVHLDRKGRGRALRHGVARERRRRRRLHGRRPVHRPRRAPAAGRPAAVGPQRPGHRHPAGQRRRGGARARSGSSSRAATTCCCHDSCGARFPTRSAASRRSAPTIAQALLPAVEDDGWFFDTELLLLAERERPAHPRGAGRLGRRPRQPRRHRRGPPWTTCAAWPGWPRRRAGVPAIGGRRRRAPPSGMAGAAAARSPSIGVVSTLRYARLFRAAAAARRVAANVVAAARDLVANTAANRRFTFGVTGPAGAVPATTSRACAVFVVGLAVTRRARRCSTLLADPGPSRRCRGRRPGRRQRRRHRAALRGPALVGVPPAARQPRCTPRVLEPR